MASLQETFSFLAPSGLYAAKIRGDGNCLFRALSDQLFGTPNHHLEIRTKIVDYMKHHPEQFKNFVCEQDAAGHRRNPRRRKAGSYSDKREYKALNSGQIETLWQSYLIRMATPREWGGNPELQAFARVYAVDVKIFRRDGNTVYIPGRIVSDDTQQVCYLAYQEELHYSSVRNIDGPHDGNPDVTSLSPTELRQRQERRAAYEAKLERADDDTTSSLNFFDDGSTSPSPSSLSSTAQTTEHSVDKAVGHESLDGGSDTSATSSQIADTQSDLTDGINQDIVDRLNEEANASTPQSDGSQKRSPKRKLEGPHRFQRNKRGVIVIEEDDDTEEEDWSQGCDKPQPRVKHDAASPYLPVLA